MLLDLSGRHQPRLHHGTHHQDCPASACTLPSICLHAAPASGRSSFACIPHALPGPLWHHTAPAIHSFWLQLCNPAPAQIHAATAWAFGLAAEPMSLLRCFARLVLQAASSTADRSAPGTCAQPATSSGIHGRGHSCHHRALLRNSDLCGCWAQGLPQLEHTVISGKIHKLECRIESSSTSSHHVSEALHAGDEICT